MIHLDSLIIRNDHDSYYSSFMPPSSNALDISTQRSRAGYNFSRSTSELKHSELENVKTFSLRLPKHRPKFL